MAKNQVIDVRDMHNGIHSLYLVTRKPKTTCNLFWQISNFNNEDFQDEFECQEIWDAIAQNTEEMGEINFRDFKGDKVWHNGVLTSYVTYSDGENNYRVIGSYDIN